MAPNKRLAYVGQDLYLSGYNVGQRIVDLVGSGDVALFIAIRACSTSAPG